MSIAEFEKERDALLVEHLEQIGNYDLERLKKCLQSEYKYNVKNRSDIDNIMVHLDGVLAARQQV